jgi:hypothetical protein
VLRLIDGRCSPFFVSFRVLEATCATIKVVRGGNSIPDAVEDSGERLKQLKKMFSESYY